MQLEFHQLELTYQATRAHDAKRRAVLVASLCEHGQQCPVVVVEQRGTTPARYVLIDGYQRVTALQKLGHDTVAAVVLPLDEVAALCLTHRLQVAQQRTPLEQGWMLSELIERHEISQVKLGLMMGHSVSWVSRRLALVRELPAQAQELVRKGVLCPHGAMRYLIPLARAKRADCERLVANLCKRSTPMSARQLGRLYVAWRSANTVERARIVAHPLLYLKAEAAASEASSTPYLPSPERGLRKDLEAIRETARRVSQRLSDERELVRPLPLVLVQVWQKTRLAMDELQQQMEGRAHAGSGYTRGDLHAP